ncbi:MAG: endonuclease/exonuclease/phosphatase family protein [Collinsella sp.]
MPQTYTFASWNVNGLRAVLKKDPSFIQIAQELDVDILALQETKLQEGQVDIDLPGYHQTWSYAERKGYSGTAVFSRQEPLRVLHADALLPYAGEGEAPSSLPKPQPRAASARWSSTSSGLWMSTLPTRKTNSPASTCAWPGTMPTATF